MNCKFGSLLTIHLVLPISRSHLSKLYRIYHKSVKNIFGFIKMSLPSKKDSRKKIPQKSSEYYYKFKTEWTF